MTHHSFDCWSIHWFSLWSYSVKYLIDTRWLWHYPQIWSAQYHFFMWIGFNESSNSFFWQHQGSKFSVNVNGIIIPHTWSLRHYPNPLPHAPFAILFLLYYSLFTLMPSLFPWLLYLNPFIHSSILTLILSLDQLFHSMSLVFKSRHWYIVWSLNPFPVHLSPMFI